MHPLSRPDRASILSAMEAYLAGDRPAHMGEHFHWHIRHPDTGYPLPLKAIWALATTGINTDFTNSLRLREQLAGLGFNCVELDGSTPTVQFGCLFPEEQTYSEGEEQSVVVNRYERDPKARTACLTYFYEKRGRTACEACGLDFADRYGELGAGFIHVHHKVPLATRGESYTLDPREDLVPLCPNCHAMIHRLPKGQDTVKDLRDKLLPSSK
ncbi:HNH endonuclease [Thioclava indica]|uniref:HNH endonuclease n=1 Tax=Thioclava indica TaxID=1353528 RepID=UPI0009DF1E05|nr:HNH endonuclease [Thioclava indica]